MEKSKGKQQNQKKRDKKQVVKSEHKMKKVVGSSKDRVQSKISENMSSSKFRYLNELLYKTPSFNAVQMFRDQPHLFDDVSFFSSLG